MQKISEDEFTQIKQRAKKWSDRSIAIRAKRMGNPAFLLHYRQGYQLYSSIEHADVMALSGYIQDEETNLLINSGPSDAYVGLVLADNFRVMADLLVAAMNYFGIQHLDIREKLTTTWEGLNRRVHFD